MSGFRSISTNSIERAVEETRRDIAEFNLGDGSESNVKTAAGSARYGVDGDLYTPGQNTNSVVEHSTTFAESNTYPDIIIGANTFIGPAVSDGRNGTVPGNSNTVFQKSSGTFASILAYLRDIDTDGSTGVYLWILNVTWPAGTFSAGTHTITLSDGTKTVTKSAVSHVTTEPISLHIAYVDVEPTETGGKTITPTISPTPTTSSGRVHFAVAKISDLDSNSITVIA